jgi:hypothetical protein
MPGPINPATPIGTLPHALSTQFAESHSVQMNINEYHDGNSQRTALVTGSRRSWKLAQRLDPVHIGLLSDFWDSAKSGAFYFYNPSETIPPYTQTPSGTVGQYLVRFNNDWEQTNGMGRIDTAIELIEVGSSTDL